MTKTAIFTLDIIQFLLLNSLYNLTENSKFTGQVLVSDFSKRHSKSDASRVEDYVFFYWEKYMKQTNTTETLIDDFATRFAEIRLSELGYNFMPEVIPLLKKIVKNLQAKALIVKNTNLVIDDGNTYEKTN